MANIEYEYENVYIVGDVHGKWGELNDIISNLPKGSLIIQVGDFGMGFPAKRTSDLKKKFEKHLASKQIDLFILRGNHDDCSYWSEDKESLVENIKFVKDYETIRINNKKFMFCGGAISIDRTEREQGSSYWAGEEIKRIDIQTLDTCDILILHTCPTEFYPIGVDAPIVQDFCRQDETLRDELIKERAYLSELVCQVKPKSVYYGHFHENNTEFINGKKTVLVGELSIVKL